jgi:hypothetical protein
MPITDRVDLSPQPFACNLVLVHLQHIRATLEHVRGGYNVRVEMGE